MGLITPYSKRVALKSAVSLRINNFSHRFEIFKLLQSNIKSAHFILEFQKGR